MVDFNINLAKSMTSSPEQRQRFYHNMLIYLVVCSALMVGVAYLSATYIVDAVKANQDRKQRIATMSAITEYGESLFEEPDRALQELKYYAADLDTLHDALQERSQFLPVISAIFKDFPEIIALQSLSAASFDKSIQFNLLTPVIDEEGENILRNLQNRWQENTALQALVNNGVTQLTSENEWVGDVLYEHATYRCTLK